MTILETINKNKYQYLFFLLSIYIYFFVNIKQLAFSFFAIFLTLIIIILAWISIYYLVLRKTMLGEFIKEIFTDFNKKN